MSRGLLLSSDEEKTVTRSLLPSRSNGRAHRSTLRGDRYRYTRPVFSLESVHTTVIQMNAIPLPSNVPQAWARTLSGEVGSLTTWTVMFRKMSLVTVQTWPQAFSTNTTTGGVSVKKWSATGVSRQHLICTRRLPLVVAKPIWIVGVNTYDRLISRTGRRRSR